MSRTTVLLTAVLVLAGCSRTPNVRLASAPESSGWNVQLNTVSQPPEVVLTKPSAIASQEAASFSQKPARGRKFVVVNLTVTATDRNSAGGLVLEQIGLQAHENDSSLVIGIAVPGARAWKDTSSNKTIPEFFFFSRYGRSTIEDGKGNRLFIVDEGVLTFLSRDPQHVELLFSVPESPGEMLLHF